MYRRKLVSCVAFAVEHTTLNPSNRFIAIPSTSCITGVKTARATIDNKRKTTRRGEAKWKIIDRRALELCVTR